MVSCLSTVTFGMDGSEHETMASRRTIVGLKPEAGYVAPQLTPEEEATLWEEERECQLAAHFESDYGGVDFDWDEDAARTASDLEKAFFPIVEEAMYADVLENAGLQVRQPEVETSRSSDDGLKALLIAVWASFGHKKKPLKAEVIAKAVGLAVARRCGQTHLQHPREIAKEVGVRAQTFHAVLNVAIAEIDRLGIAQELQKNGNLE